jgi:sigma-B regulation protein RsbU (phosphoserine phosphatase)
MAWRIRCSPSLRAEVLLALGEMSGDGPDLYILDADDTCNASHEADAGVPVLSIGSVNERLACLQAGADAFLSFPLLPAELTAQAHTLIRRKREQDRLLERSHEAHQLHERLQEAYHQIDLELALAQRLQASFLPQSLPQVPHIRFAVHYLLCGRVGGDFYDTFRLDEKHVGFYVADAMGHGVPASLLTIFVKKGVRTKEVFGNQYRLIPPDEVLERLNRDLIDQQLSEQPFITMVYGLLNHQDGTVRLARAGHPFPLLVPREGEMSLWKPRGMLLGFQDAAFPCITHHLAPGDKLLLYTDGVDYARFGSQPAGIDSLLACAEVYRGLPASDFVAALSQELFANSPPADDLTLLALERSE